MQKYRDVILNHNGNPVYGASVTVYSYPGSTAATIYSDNGSTVTTNPLTTDINGEFSFYAGDGRYSLSITGSGINSVTVSDIILEDNASGPQVITANSSSAALTVTQTGAGNAFVVEDVASDTTPFVIDQNGRVAIGNTATVLGSLLENHGTTDSLKFSADAIGQYLRFFKSRSATAATPWATVVASGDSLGAIDFYGADGTNPILAARINAGVDGTPGTNDMPGRLVFSTTADGAGSPTERMRIDSFGNIMAMSATGLLGYGTGAGGTVTQATSKATGVTLSKPCGQITMYGVNDVNGQMTSLQTIGFTVTNTLVSDKDLVLVNLKTGFTAGAYSVWTDIIANGSFNIFVKNLTGGTLANALVINFAIIKGA